jgi:hypothetical protein
MNKTKVDRRARLLAQALAQWRAVKARDEGHFPGGAADQDEVDAFARWLIQYSGLVEAAVP